METKFTPGPHYRDNEYIRDSKNGCALARVYEDDGHIVPEYRRALPAEANSHLFAAASEMYEALELALAEVATDSNADGGLEAEEKFRFVRTARTALAKARGETP